MQLIILDRDGVINEDRGDYIKGPEECQPIAGSVEAIARLCRAGYTVVVATNQSGLARGLFDLDALEAIHDKLSRAVEAAGGQLSAIFYCPHHPDEGCRCRKPATGMLEAIEAEFNLSVTDVPFVGDSLRDLQAAAAKGCRPLLVHTGNGTATREQLAGQPELADTPGFADLAAVTEQLLSEA